MPALPEPAGAGSSFELVARALRNGKTEEWHYGAAALVTPQGELVGRVGDPELAVFMRSVAKPFQAVRLLLAGGWERFALEPADLALICASHVGTPAHEARAASILARAGCTEDDLRCGIHAPFDAAVRRALCDAGESPRVLQNNCSGKHAGMLCACRLQDLPVAGYIEPEHPLQRQILDDLECGIHPPFDAEVRRALAAAGEPPRILQNNCSGKHAGMLCACRLLGLPTAGYIDPAHPLQRRILDDLARFAGLAVGDVGLGTDGCSLPTYLVPLEATARAYAALADPEAAGVDRKLVPEVRRIVDAMTSVPEMVAGSGHFTTRLMQTTGGRILGKEGAQGYYAAAVRGPVALGLVLKVADGDLRCRDGVVLELLRQAGVLSGAELDELGSFHRVEILSHRGRVVGEVVPEVELTV